MSDIVFLAIAPNRLERMRRRGSDEYGNPWTEQPAEGWEPLRCCLRTPQPGELITLICYTPWTQPSPWLEAGPVFVHSRQCEGYETPSRYPEAFRHSRSMLNPFGHEGSRAYQHITYLAPDDDHEAAARTVLAQLDVA